MAAPPSGANESERAWIECALNVLYSTARGTVAPRALADLAAMIERRTAAIGDELSPEAVAAVDAAKGLRASDGGPH